MAAGAMLAVPLAVFGLPGEAQALAVVPNFRNYELRTLPDVNAGMSSGEAAAAMDAERNSAGLAEGAPATVPIPETDPSATRWRNVGGSASSLISAAMFMPFIFQVGDAVSGGMFSKAAKDDCAIADQNFVGALSAWAAGMAGFSCQPKADVPKDPGYLPQYHGQSGPAGFPQTIVAPTYANTYGGSVSWGTPYWSTRTFVARDGSGKTYQEGWVYPVNWTGNYYSAIGPPDLYVTLLIRGADGSIVSTQANMGGRGAGNLGLSTGTCTAQACISVARLGDLNGGDPTFALGGDAAISSISGDTGAGRINSVPVTPPPGYSIQGSAGAPATGTAAEVMLRTIETDDQGHTAQCDTRQFLETDTVIPQPCEPTLPSGWGVTQHHTIEIVPATGSEAPNVIQDYDTSPGFREQQSAHPQCATQVCLLTLTKIAGSPTGECSDFSTSPNPCADWYADSSKSNDYQCEYGGSVVDLSECNVYAPLYKPGSLTAGTAYAPPGTDPSAPPQTQTSKPPATDGGPSTITPPGPTGDSSSCFAQGFGSPNPIDWVLTPVKCALQWAFVPDDATTQADVQGMQHAWDQTFPVEAVTMVSAWHLDPSVSECGGIPYDFHLGGFGGSTGSTDLQGTLLNACDPTLAPWAGIVKAVSTIVIIIGCIISVTRSAAAVIGYTGLAGSGESST